MLRKIFKQLNVYSQCKNYRLPLWQCPHFLFLIMGVIIGFVTVFLYLIGTHYLVDPLVVSFIVLGTAVILFIVAYIIVNGFEKLAEASKLKSEFINIVSHQLRSPLTNIKWSFELLSSPKIKIKKNSREEYFNNIRENISRMVELIDDLLIVSRLEEGRFPMLRREVSLEGIIEDQVLRFKIFSQASGVKLIFHSPKQMPKVFVDPSLMKIVIENLIDNAIHYTKKQGQVVVQLGKKGDNSLLFKIEDNGIGIPKDEQKYIFKKFFRAKNASKKSIGGNGLGLYVCRSIIEKFGGKMWFKSEENKGTTFYFTLPIKQKSF